MTAWTKFLPATAIPPTAEHIAGMRKSFPQYSEADIQAIFADMDATETLYKNNRYQVAVRRVPSPGGNWPEMLHLSIKRLDREQVGRERYRDFMRIRDELIGPEYEAVELYPARSREIDTANQYHLWLITSGQFPFGWNDGAHRIGDSNGGAKQEPFAD